MNETLIEKSIHMLPKNGLTSILGYSYFFILSAALTDVHVYCVATCAQCQSNNSIEIIRFIKMFDHLTDDLARLDCKPMGLLEQHLHSLKSHHFDYSLKKEVYVLEHTNSQQTQRETDNYIVQSVLE